MRVAVAQFAIGADLDANLKTCLRMLQAAASCNPDLIVLPEFSNHLSWYEDQAHCYQVSLALDGDFLQAIARQAQEINAHVVINCSIRRDKPICTGTSLLYSPRGELLAGSDKQVLIGHENDFLRKAQQTGPVIETPMARIGLYACMDGVINETPRCLALRGAQLMCNSLNSFASDEGSLHIPVRAAENKVFVAAANKVGPLIPEAILEPVSRETGIPVEFLMGAGESQLVAPDGTVLARASLDREEFVYADINPVDADHKLRPDDTHVFAMRRPQLYGALAEDPAGQVIPAKARPESAAVLAAALIQLEETGAGAVKEATEHLSAAFASGVQLAVLPPLFYLPDQTVTDVATAITASSNIVAGLADLCGQGQYIATTLVLGEPTQLSGVLIGNGGVILRQGPLHTSQRFAWSALSDKVVVADIQAARVAVLTSDDACLPESSRLATLAGADILVVPAQPLERWELTTGLLERSAENRINLLVAAQPGELGTSFATALTRDFTVLTPWEERQFDGLLSQPPIIRAQRNPGITPVELHPRWATNKVVSRGTDLLADRPWPLLEPLLEPLSWHY